MIDARRDPNSSADRAAGTPGNTRTLSSLAPRYDPDAHATYVRHLNQAIDDPKNRNIALTGQYGSGKSSILDQFIGQNTNKKLQGRPELKIARITINTLGADPKSDLTNRIQKELVKQLIYRPEPGKIRGTRFARHVPPSWLTISLQGGLAGVVVSGALYLLGVWPDRSQPGPGWLPGALLAGITLMMAVVLRRLIGNRLVSEFGTAGTSIKLEKRGDSYFDEYLHEIITFFDTTETDLVVFEDLDRFEEPRIFDSLRELNTIVNASSHWVNRRVDGTQRPLRFVYAIKDSLFEKLGEEPTRSNDGQRSGSTDATKLEDDEMAGAPVSQRRDTAEVAVERANRTKFFDIVIPVVPFLSHNNARDKLIEELHKRDLPGGDTVSRDLIDVVARHTTDMRLMINICNEFVVFAEQLLWIPQHKQAPGITADRLFALVVYKNFHLADFEAIPQRRSTLDSLERRRRELVSEAITRLQHQRSEESVAHDRQQEKATIITAAERLLKQLSGGGLNHGAKIDNVELEPRELESLQFWERLSKAEKMTLWSDPANFASRKRADYERDFLDVLFADVRDPALWRDIDAHDLKEIREKIDDHIASLRGADFTDLLGESSHADGTYSFDQIIEETLSTGLARELVRRGFIDRYYAEYVSPFYGKFLGVDVANFFRNYIWPNEMGVHETFDSDENIRNVVDEAPKGFTSSRAVLNLDIVDYLLKTEHAKAAQVAAFIVAEANTENVREFFETFLATTYVSREELVTRLAAQQWRDLCNRLVAIVPSSDRDLRESLLDKALREVETADGFDLDDHVIRQLQESYNRLSAFTDERDDAGTKVAFGLLKRIFDDGVPDLAALSKELRQLCVEEGGYELSADNLRTVLDLSAAAPVGLEQIKKDTRVWERCLGNIEDYLDRVVAHDERTPYAICTPDVLVTTIVELEQVDALSGEQLTALLERSALDSALPSITSVPPWTWPFLVDTGHIEATVANVGAYEAEHHIDNHLARFLTTSPSGAKTLHKRGEMEESRQVDLLHKIVNAHSLGPAQAVALGTQIVEDPAGAVSLDRIEPREGNLLEELLRVGWVDDSLGTFQHFLSAGWLAIATAFRASNHAHEFVTANLIEDPDAVPALLGDSNVSGDLKRMLVGDLGTFVPDDSHETALRAATEYADRNKMVLPVAQLRRVAPHLHDAPELVLRQLARVPSASSGTEIAEVLAQLGGDFAGFGKPSGHTFAVPVTAEMTKILRRLEGEQIVKQPKRARKGRKEVKIL